MTLQHKSTETNEPSSKFLMGLAPDHCNAFGEPEELCLTTEEVSTIDNAVLRRYAAESDHPDIKGKGTADLVLREYFKAQTVIDDFAEE